MCKYMAERSEANPTGCEPSEVSKNEADRRKAMIAEAKHSEAYFLKKCAKNLQKNTWSQMGFGMRKKI